MTQYTIRYDTYDTIRYDARKQQEPWRATAATAGEGSFGGRAPEVGLWTWGSGGGASGMRWIFDLCSSPLRLLLCLFPMLSR